MSSLDKLIKYFETFPGIGARQARRFAFHILTMKKEDVSEFSTLISSLQDTVVECQSCRRFFAQNGHQNLCRICSDETRDHTKLLIVERDSDIQSIERSGVYEGLYFVLGGTVPLLDSIEAKNLRGGSLKRTITERLSADLSEVILGFSINPDGENTARFIESVIADIPEAKSLTVSHLGRGLSTGSELEYADPETIKSALQNRH
ncbi:recombination protein RecR [Candidatus Kaiserbacteria bacterium]|nr:recombination protein RecR [Candidatus Kaiserbacteria bacterium]MCB9811789.1 recombination protein RecR [Candidatus Nomurabacteria bacterium]